jgi:hypothetical protein
MDASHKRWPSQGKTAGAIEHQLAAVLQQYEVDSEVKKKALRVSWVISSTVTVWTRSQASCELESWNQLIPGARMWWKVASTAQDVCYQN